MAANRSTVGPERQLTLYTRYDSVATDAVARIEVPVNQLDSRHNCRLGQLQTLPERFVAIARAFRSAWRGT